MAPKPTSSTHFLSSLLSTSYQKHKYFQEEEKEISTDQPFLLYSLHMRSLASKMFNTELPTADKGQGPAWGLGEGLIRRHCKEC
jgi:hypothetical protein